MGKYRGSRQTEIDALIQECSDYYQLQRTRALLREIREGQNWSRELIESRRVAS